MQTAMARLTAFACLFAALFLVPPPPAGADGVAADDDDAAAADASLVIILDASGSMAADDGTGTPRIAAAKRAVGQVLSEPAEGLDVGLRVYGHRTPNTDRERGCADTELVVPVGPVDPDDFRTALDAIGASGYTPIAAALQAAVADLPATGDRTILLISDGIDTCSPPDPCEVARGLAADGVDVTVETVGFQVDASAQAVLRCIADATGGGYRDAADATELADALRAYRTRGQRVEGGDDPTSATALEAGQYLDTLAPGAARWYRVALGEGQVLAVASTLSAPAETPPLRRTDLALELRRGDVLGELRCERDSVPVSGPGPFHVAVTTGRTGADTELCTGPGERFIRLALEQVRPEELGAPRLPVELVVAVEDPDLAGAGLAPEADRTSTGVPGRGVIAAEPPAGGAQLVGLAVLAGGLLGAAAGTRATRARLR